MVADRGRSEIWRSAQHTYITLTHLPSHLSSYLIRYEGICTKSSIVSILYNMVANDTDTNRVHSAWSYIFSQVSRFATVSATKFNAYSVDGTRDIQVRHHFTVKVSCTH